MIFLWILFSLIICNAISRFIVISKLCIIILKPQYLTHILVQSFLSYFFFFLGEVNVLKSTPKTVQRKAGNHIYMASTFTKTKSAKTTVLRPPAFNCPSFFYLRLLSDTFYKIKNLLLFFSFKRRNVMLSILNKSLNRQSILLRIYNWFNCIY